MATNKQPTTTETLYLKLLNTSKIPHLQTIKNHYLSNLHLLKTTEKELQKQINRIGMITTKDNQPITKTNILAFIDTFGEAEYKKQQTIPTANKTEIIKLITKQKNLFYFLNTNKETFFYAEYCRMFENNNQRISNIKEDITPLFNLDFYKEIAETLQTTTTFIYCLSATIRTIEKQLKKYRNIIKYFASNIALFRLMAKNEASYIALNIDRKTETKLKNCLLAL